MFWNPASRYQEWRRPDFPEGFLNIYSVIAVVLDTNVLASGFVRPEPPPAPTIRILKNTRLQKLGSYRGVAILSPQAFLDLLSSQRPG